MTTINIFQKVGPFAENKDEARKIRINEIVPKLEKGEDVILNFKNIEAATQSFIHALISDLIRKYGDDLLDKISFQSCNENVKIIIMIVTDYMQESD